MAANDANKKGDRGARLGLSAKREESMSKWYQELVTRSDMIEYYEDVSGCYILRPWSYTIWELIQKWMNDEITSAGVQNAYFPLLVAKSSLEKEEDHIEGFAPEVAWVTKAGQSELQMPLAIRPTSETIMYPAFAKWIRSHRDLPLMINQWCSVVRWEFKHPMPFLRSREFLWQEGHSAFATKEEADKEVLERLDMYARAFEDVLAIPVLRGMKSDKEKFAGGLYTTSVEAFVPGSGRGIQAATSHCLGQNFSKMFNIQFDNEVKGGRSLVWQNSWGFTTRSIGIMLMVHSDNRGVVLPPRVAPFQVVIVPIIFKDNRDTLVAKCVELAKTLRTAGVRVHVDDRDGYKPGFKYNHWELRGVPLRIELGPRDIQNSTCEVVRRLTVSANETSAKQIVKLDDLVNHVKSSLDEFHKFLFERARVARDSHIKSVTAWSDFVPTLNGGNLVKAPWCDTTVCEDSIKQRSGDEAKQIMANQDDEAMQLSSAAKTMCKPFAQDALAAGTKCFACDKEAKTWVLLGRCY